MCLLLLLLLLLVVVVVVVPVVGVVVVVVVVMIVVVVVMIVVVVVVLQNRDGLKGVRVRSEHMGVLLCMAHFQPPESEAFPYRLRLFLGCCREPDYTIPYHDILYDCRKATCSAQCPRLSGTLRCVVRRGENQTQTMICYTMT